jgi:hypothetical protein
VVKPIHQHGISSEMHQRAWPILFKDCPNPRRIGNIALLKRPASGPRKAVSAPSRPKRIDKSALAIPQARRYRDKAHIKFVASRFVCGRKPCDPHHLRFAQVRALGRKVSDEFTVPLCRLHHRELHRSRDELHWWKKLGLEPLKIATQLWDRTRSSLAPEIGTPTEASSSSTSPMPEVSRRGTGPRSLNGKQGSRRNALRHGLTTETLIEPLEDPESYRAFEAARKRARSPMCQQ